ncbi:unnamed protein product [Calicophoron daubneyi]|uniref:CCHC-type domain-containing protein n=1 Tax=Calicophoron daubneyi TaxID=300641 RepID=A0AAV2T0B7_CALDB
MGSMKNMSESKNALECSSELTRQVPAGVPLSPACPSNLSCHFDPVTSNSYPAVNFKARERWFEAKLREKRLNEEMELDILRRKLEMKERLLAMRTETDQAEIEIRMHGNVDDVKFLESACSGLDAEINSIGDCNLDAVGGGRSLVELFRSLELPKVEIAYFDGDPADYWRFIKSFDANVASKTLDSTARLSFLIQYCRGLARKTIEGCAILSSDEVYAKARSILESRFGQRHVIARAQIRRVISGPNIKPGDGAGLLNLATDLRNCVVMLTQMNYLADLNCCNTIMSVLRRLPHNIQSQWAEQAYKILQSGREPLMEDLADLVELKAAVVNSEYGQLIAGKSDWADVPHDTRHPPKSHISWVQNDHMPHDPVNPKGSSLQSVSLSDRCLLCSALHAVRSCGRFLENNIQGRRNIVRFKNLCNLCLKPGHFARNCQVSSLCAKCGGRHNVLLHVDNYASSTQINADKKEVSGTCSATSIKQDEVFLGVVPVRLTGPRGTIETLAFIDSGSDATLVERSTADKLGLTGNEAAIKLSTLNGTSSHQCRRVERDVCSLSSDDVVRVDCAYAVDHLPRFGGRRPTLSDLKPWPHLQDLQLPALDKGDVSILVGCNVPEAHWVLEQRKGDRKQPYAVKTPLGWMVLGPATPQNENAVICNRMTVAEEEVKGLVSSMFALGSPGSERREEKVSLEDQMAAVCDRISVHKKERQSKIKPPCKDEPCRHLENKALVENQTRTLQKELLRDLVMMGQRNSIVDNYISKEYVEEVMRCLNENKRRPRWYLPHHHVGNPWKPEKLRMLLDCAVYLQGVCLNDMLLQCPDLTGNVIGVLLSFGKNQITMTADLQESFSQVWMPLEECDMALWQVEIDEAKIVENVSVTRCWKPGSSAIGSTKLHCFSDASKSAYGRVSCLRWVSPDGRMHGSFMLSKSRVAPIRAVTIPRLQLMATLLSTETAAVLRKECMIPIDGEFFWADYMIVWRCIQNTNSRFETFVADRLVIVRKNPEVKRWHNIRSIDNPAGIASTGISAKHYWGMKICLNGPKFRWTFLDNCLTDNGSPFELKVEKDCDAVWSDKTVDVIEELLKRNSEWFRFNRFEVYIFVMFGKLAENSVLVKPLQRYEVFSAIEMNSMHARYARCWKRAHYMASASWKRKKKKRT